MYKNPVFFKISIALSLRSGNAPLPPPVWVRPYTMEFRNFRQKKKSDQQSLQKQVSLNETSILFLNVKLFAIISGLRIKITCKR
jgi:hypothetical protein